MKGLAITSKGIEDIAAAEIKELTGAKCKAEECAVSFEHRNFKIYACCSTSASLLIEFCI